MVSLSNHEPCSSFDRLRMSGRRPGASGADHAEQRRKVIGNLHCESIDKVTIRCKIDALALIV